MPPGPESAMPAASVFEWLNLALNFAFAILAFWVVLRAQTGRDLRYAVQGARTLFIASCVLPGAGLVLAEPDHKLNIAVFAGSTAILVLARRFESIRSEYEGVRSSLQVSKSDPKAA